MKNANSNLKALEGLFTLPVNIKLFIPSTIEVNKKAKHIQKKFTDVSLLEFAELFGGATSYKAIGAWNSPTVGLMKEDVVIVESFATVDAINKGISKIIELAKRIKKEMSQDSIALEYQNKLFLI